MSSPSLDMIYEDNHLLVANKPAGLLCDMPQAHEIGHRESLLVNAREFIKARDQKPGNVYLNLVHRIDQPVSGIVIFAKTSKAAARLNSAFRERTVRKTYTALCTGIAPQTGELKHLVARDEATRKTYVSDLREDLPLALRPSAQPAHLHITHVRPHRLGHLLTIDLGTGRTHQIRAQLAFVGLPIVNDAKYGGEMLLTNDGIALHASHVTLPHPTLGKNIDLDSSPDWALHAPYSK